MLFVSRFIFILKVLNLKLKIFGLVFFMIFEFEKNSKIYKIMLYCKWRSLIDKLSNIEYDKNWSSWIKNIFDFLIISIYVLNVCSISFSSSKQPNFIKNSFKYIFLKHIDMTLLLKREILSILIFFNDFFSTFGKI